MELVSRMRTHLASRIILLGLSCAVGTVSLVQGTHGASLQQELLGASMLLFGLSWFLQPVILDRALFTKPLLSPSKRAPAIGPLVLRVVIDVLAIGSMAASAVQGLRVGA